MMTKTATVRARIEPDLKTDVESLLNTDFRRTLTVTEI